MIWAGEAMAVRTGAFWRIRESCKIALATLSLVAPVPCCICSIGIRSDRLLRGIVAVIALGLFIVASVTTPAVAETSTDVTFETGSLVIESGGGSHPFTIELARSPEQRSRGLMFRETMAPDAGMLFIYPRRQRISMWMKNTILPLDMLFIDSDGTIVRIAEWTQPHSLRTIESGGRVLGVLELNAGTSARLGIAVGDRVRHPAFD